MRTTTKTPSTPSDVDLRCLSQASSYLTSAISAHREGSTTQAYVMAESAASVLLSYISRSAGELGITPHACITQILNKLTAHEPR